MVLAQTLIQNDTPGGNPTLLLIYGTRLWRPPKPLAITEGVPHLPIEIQLPLTVHCSPPTTLKSSPQRLMHQYDLRVP